MKSVVDTTIGLGRKLQIEIPAEQVSDAFMDSYKYLQKSVNVKGFRKGKTPIATIKQMYRDQVKEDVSKRLIQMKYQEALSEHSLNPVNYPDINADIIEDGRDFKFSAEFEIRPAVELKEYEGLQLEKEEITIGEEQVNESIESLRKNYSETAPVLEERALANGDIADIDFEGIIDEKPLENGSAKGHELEVGSDQFIPGFEEKLIGMKTADERLIELNFPEDYGKADLAGKAVTFKVKLNAIKKRSMPDLNDEFAKKVDPKAESIDQLKEKIKTDLEQREGSRVEEDLKNALVKQLVEKNPIEAPQCLMRQEKQRMIKDMEQKMKSQGMSANEFQEYTDKWNDDFENSAEQLVKSAFLFDAISDKHEIKVTDSDVDTKIKGMLDPLPAEYREQYEGFYNSAEMKTKMKDQILHEKVMSFLIEKAQISTVNK